MSCPTCNGTGVIETGNNDLPCDCPAGNTAKFNISVEGRLRQLSGSQVRAVYGPGPLPTTTKLVRKEPLVEVAEDARDTMLARRIFDAFDKFVHVPPELEAKLLAQIEQELKKP